MTDETSVIATKNVNEKNIWNFKNTVAFVTILLFRKYNTVVMGYVALVHNQRMSVSIMHYSFLLNHVCICVCFFNLIRNMMKININCLFK